ncbi:hypothetical protein ACK34W_05335 [Aeromonas veronii]
MHPFECIHPYNACKQFDSGLLQKVGTKGGCPNCRWAGCKAAPVICLNNAGLQVAEAVTPGGIGAAGAIGIGKTVAEATAAKALATNALRSTTGTVFDSMKSTQPLYPGSVIPKSFEMTLPNAQKVWGHGNATEHMTEYAASKAVTHTPEAVRLVSQEELRSFQTALNNATKN